MLITKAQGMTQIWNMWHRAQMRKKRPHGIGMIKAVRVQIKSSKSFAGQEAKVCLLSDIVEK